MVSHPALGEGKTYYFVVFSSARDSSGGSSTCPAKTGNARNRAPRSANICEPASQLYMAAVVDDGSGAPKTYSAVYMWNQRNVGRSGGDAMGKGAKVTDTQKTTNVTPAWNEFQIPPVPPTDTVIN